jgi:hypothetical protein
MLDGDAATLTRHPQVNSEKADCNLRSMGAFRERLTGQFYPVTTRTAMNYPASSSGHKRICGLQLGHRCTGGRGGASGTILSLVLAVLLLTCRLGRLSFEVRDLWGLKDSTGQILEILASLRAFVVLVFHLFLLSSKAGWLYVDSSAAQEDR